LSDARKIDFLAKNSLKKRELRILMYLQQIMPTRLLESVHPVNRDGKKCREFVALEFKNEAAAIVIFLSLEIIKIFDLTGTVL